MAECTPTGGTKIPSSGDSTLEYNAIRKSRGEIEPAINPDDFVSRAHSCGLIPTHNPSRPPLDVVLNEISRDPVNYYSLTHVLATLNVGNRFDKGISKMETTFQCKDDECDMTYMYIRSLDMISLVSRPFEEEEKGPGTHCTRNLRSIF